MIDGENEGSASVASSMALYKFDY